MSKANETFSNHMSSVSNTLVPLIDLIPKKKRDYYADNDPHCNKPESCTDYHSAGMICNPANKCEFSLREHNYVRSAYQSSSQETLKVVIEFPNINFTTGSYV